MTLTDAQLLATAKLEYNMTPPSSQAFESILLRYEKLIYYIARRYFSSTEDVLDASQDASLKIYNGLPRITIAEDGSLKPWICTVVARTCIDALRKNKVATVDITDDAVQHSLPTAISAEETASVNERANEILTAIKNLPNDARMIIILRDMQGLSYDEIAKCMELNVGTVKSRLSRARAMLKKAIDAGN